MNTRLGLTPSAAPVPERMTQIAIRIGEIDRARIDAIVERGDARTVSGALRFALALAERHYREGGLVDQFAEASREWRDSGDAEAWQASEPDAL